MTVSDSLLGLADLLLHIEAFDAHYERRELLVWEALALARRLGLPAGVRIDPAEPEWPVVFIELPTGQVSWHQPEHPERWDGHDTDAKYARCWQFHARLSRGEV
jgi:hypothetical protein